MKYYIVVRQDDNGFKTEVIKTEDKFIAEETLSQFESFKYKPHKMTYWIEEKEK